MPLILDKASNVEMTTIEPDPSFRSRTSLIQLGYGIWVNFTTMAIGLAYGFPAVQIPQLNSPDSDVIVSIEEASWIASILSLFCPFGCMLSGLLMDKFGRKVMVMCCHLPISVGWIYTGVSDSASHLIIARAILGIGCGMAMGPPRLFTAEISLPNMRGLLGAFPNIFLSLGITTQAALGLFFPWTNLSFICCAFSVTVFVSYLLLTETPYYLLMKSTAHNARKALAAFRGKGYNVDKEMNQLIEFKQDNNIRSLTFREKLKAMFSGPSCKPFAIIVPYIAFGCLTGGPVVTFWTIDLLQKTNSSFNVYTGNFLIALTRLIFGVVASALLFGVGRKTLALISASGVCLVCTVLGSFLYLKQEPSLVPQICLTVYTAFASMGFYILPFLLMSELYPLQLRGTLTGLSISITNIGVFSTAKCFPYVRDGLGVPNTILLFAFNAFLCFIFLYLFLPETKDLSLREIEEYFNRRRPTLMSDRQLMILQRNERSFVEVDDLMRTSSISSRDSKKSVTLVIGDKQFKSMTAAEDAEMRHMKDMVENAHKPRPKDIVHGTSNEPRAKEIPEEVPVSPHFFDEPEHHIKTEKQKPKPKSSGEKPGNAKKDNTDLNTDSKASSKSDLPSTSKNVQPSKRDEKRNDKK